MNALMSAAIVVAQPAGWDNGGPGGEFWWIGKLVMLALWIVLIILAVRWFRGNARRNERSGIERARDILAERFARGEITTEEYHERIGQLS